MLNMGFFQNNSAEVLLYDNNKAKQGFKMFLITCVYSYFQYRSKSLDVYLVFKGVFLQFRNLLMNKLLSNLTFSMLQKHLLLTQSMWSTGHGMVKVKNVAWVFCWLQSILEAHVAAGVVEGTVAWVVVCEAPVGWS